MTSDHTPCAISASTKIPKGSLFLFENHWMEHSQFFSIVQQHWTAPSYIFYAAKSLTARFKNLRSALKTWKASISNLKEAIANVKLVLNFLPIIEEFRDLSVPEWNFRNLLSLQLQRLLKQQTLLEAKRPD